MSREKRMHKSKNEALLDFKSVAKLVQLGKNFVQKIENDLTFVQLKKTKI